MFERINYFLRSCSFSRAARTARADAKLANQKEREKIEEYKYWANKVQETTYSSYGESTPIGQMLIQPSLKVVEAIDNDPLLGLSKSLFCDPRRFHNDVLSLARRYEGNKEDRRDSGRSLNPDIVATVLIPRMDFNKHEKRSNHKAYLDVDRNTLQGATQMIATSIEFVRKMSNSVDPIAIQVKTFGQTISYHFGRKQPYDRLVYLLKQEGVKVDTYGMVNDRVLSDLEVRECYKEGNSFIVLALEGSTENNQETLKLGIIDSPYPQ